MTKTRRSADPRLDGFEDSIVGIIADGLDAFGDGRGWDARHERAKALANAAPALLEALKKVLDRWDRYDEEDAPGLGAEIRAAIAAAEGRSPRKEPDPADSASERANRLLDDEVEDRLSGGGAWVEE